MISLCDRTIASVPPSPMTIIMTIIITIIINSMLSLFYFMHLQSSVNEIGGHLNQIEKFLTTEALDIARQVQ